MDEKGNFNCHFFLAIRQAKGKLETLDAEFRQRHVAVVNKLENDEELEFEQAVLDDHDNKVACITVYLDHLTNREDTSVGVKLEGETQQLLHKRLANIERSIRSANA